MRILITGGSGFVGGHLLRALLAAGHRPVAAVRHGWPEAPCPTTTVGEINGTTDWAPALAGADAVVHLAARVHMMRDPARDPLAAFRAVNTDGTRTLASQAAQAGVRRFVYVSTIKVMGERAPAARPFSADTPRAPSDPYATSKAAAETALWGVAEATGLAATVIRPPLVYGPGMKGNLPRLVRLVARGVPLPFGSVRNARSVLAVGNLTHLIVRCLDHPGAIGHTLLAADTIAPATPALITALAAGVGRPARLLPVPPILLRAAALAVGRGGTATRLLDSLVVDDSQTRAALDWTPPVAQDAALAEAARAVLAPAAADP